MDKKKFFIFLISAFAIISLLLNVAFVILIIKNLQMLEQRQVNIQVLDFQNMFVEKVLLSGGAVDEDSQRSLDISVKNLDDQEITDQWYKLLYAKTQEEAVFETKALLSLLIEKIKK